MRFSSAAVIRAWPTAIPSLMRAYGEPPSSASHAFIVASRDAT